MTRMDQKLDDFEITPEWLKAVRERAFLNNPTGKVDSGCTCASCARLVLLEEVERNQSFEAEINKGRFYDPPPIKDTIGGRLASAAFEFANADSFFNCPCCEDSGWHAYGKAMGHAFRAAELAYDARVTSDSMIQKIRDILDMPNASEADLIEEIKEGREAQKDWVLENGGPISSV